MKRNVKIFCAALALVLVFGAVVGGTIAWLMETTNTITNTFTIGKVDITLTETIDGVKTTVGNSPITNDDFKLIPGEIYDKDPTVTVVGGSEECYLFVKVDPTNNVADFVDYAIASGWTALPGATSVYYRTVGSSADDQEFDILGYDANGNEEGGFTADKVMIKTDVTQADINDIDIANLPSIVISAYAVQKDNVADINAAWTLVSANA